MSGMTDGAIAAGGKVVGVIHEMFLVDRADFAEDGPHASLCSPLYELVVAGGNDLQERKKKLVGGADAIVVMPGGPGTWDELWEMACSKNIGLLDIPIVCVNVKGFYDDFEKMLRRAQDDGLLYRKPEDLVHFENTSEGAVRWIEAAVATVAEKSTFTEIKRRDSNASSALKEIKLKGKKGKLSSEKILSIGKNSILTFGAGLVIGLLLGSRIRIRS
uniref:Cytokinin riboside 5'-monophosphate phosphoribohydrolase n=2 Tax=Corethron hystrix TaxID=216773 RepID=A0A7S1FYM5_9STRA